MSALPVEALPAVVHRDDVLVQKLRDAVEAYIASNAMSHDAFAALAGLKSRQHLEQFLTNAKKPGYRLEVPTAERLAAAIGYEVTLTPKGGAS